MKPSTRRRTPVSTRIVINKLPVTGEQQREKQQMKPEETLKKPANHAHHTHLTKEDFLRWLRQKNALKKQTAGDQLAQDGAARLAVMVWADDGGQ